MHEIECVRLENTSNLMDNYLEKLIKEVDSKVKFIDWKKPITNPHTPLILIVDTEHLLEFKKIVSNREDKIIVALNSRKDFKMVSELKSHFTKIFGFIDLSQEVEYNVPILKNYLGMNFSQHALKLNQLASDLDKVYEFTKSELTKIKNLHDHFVKVRFDQFKGATLTCKFMAGEKSGGEFFDIIPSEQEILFVQAGSDSYILSSMILGEIEVLKEKTSLNLKSLSENFVNVIKHHATENKAALSYCLINIDLKTLQANITVKGKGQIFYQNELISFEGSMKLNLKPKERVMFVTEGSIKNFELLSKLTAKKFFNDNQSMTTRDLINEFFFEVSRNKAGNFLVYDALMAILEIEENFLYQLS